jgi:hypothetical protein
MTADMRSPSTVIGHHGTMRGWNQTLVGMVALLVISACDGDEQPNQSVATSTSVTTTSVTSATTTTATTTPAAPTFDVSPTTSAPGGTLAVTGEGCQSDLDLPGININITTTDRLTQLVAAHLAVQSDGSWAGSLTIPANARSTDYLVNATCAVGDVVVFEYASVRVEVVA